MKSSKSGLFMLICFLFSSCTLYGNNKLPYLIDGEMSIEESSNYNYGGVNLSLYNKSDSDITGFTVVFFLFDQDGNVPSVGRNNVVLNIDIEVAAGEKIEFCISLDNYLNEIPENLYVVDYLYLSKIQYADGSLWTDPFGISAFK